MKTVACKTHRPTQNAGLGDHLTVISKHLPGSHPELSDLTPAVETTTHVHWQIQSLSIFLGQGLREDRQSDRHTHSFDKQSHLCKSWELKTQGFSIIWVCFDYTDRLQIHKTMIIAKPIIKLWAFILQSKHLHRFQNVCVRPQIPNVIGQKMGP